MDKLAIYLGAERARINGNHQEALRLYRQVAEVDPDDWKISEGIAGELEALGQKGEAARELFQAAHRLIWRTSYEDARRLLERILRLDPAQELFVTRGVRARLEEIDRKVVLADQSSAGRRGQAQASPTPARAAALPTADAVEAVEAVEHEPGFEETRSALEALMIDESTGGLRVPDDILAMIERVPLARTSARKLTLNVLGDRLAMNGRELDIGSGDSCNLVLRQAGVREHHARIVEVDGRFLLTAESSDCPTSCNGKPADGVELSDGDVLAFGEGGAEARVEIS